MPVDINQLTDGWLTLESDPGLFTLLLEDFGVKGVQVEEIYDLQKSLDSPVYGFIFLFRWIEERRSRRKIVDQSDIFVKDEEIVNNIFFAQQMVPNSCATHSLLSVLLNCPNIHLGETLSRLKVHSSGMNPENKGWAIGNTPELAKAHNSHAMPQAKRKLDKTSGISTGRYTGEAYHFVSYVPINGRLFELDGLKPYPMDHGPWGDEEDWTEKFRKVIADRLGITTGEKYNDIRFNLMAVVPDKRLGITHKLNMLKTNRQIVMEALQQLVKLNHPDLASVSPGDKTELKTELSSGESMEPTKVSPGSKRKEAVLNGLGSAEVGDGDVPNKIPKKSVTDTVGGGDGMEMKVEDEGSGLVTLEENSEVEGRVVEDGGETLGGKTADDDADRKEVVSEEGESKVEIESRGITEGGSDLSNLSKISLIVTSENNEVVKSEILEKTKPDYSTPLTIQTSPTPSTSSTDTSSEVGSAFNSPTQGWGWNSGGQNSPNSSTKDLKKFVVIRVAMAGSSGDLGVGDDKMDPTRKGFRKVCLEAGALPKNWERAPGSKLGNLRVISPLALSDGKFKHSPSKLSSPAGDRLNPPVETHQHTFAPKDLLALLRNLEVEISVCEGNLRDENEKRKKYKVDDCRRTHNYDEFICTFLSMLAQQGKLADLVQQHLVVQRKQGVPQVKNVTQPRANLQNKKPETKFLGSTVSAGYSKKGKKSTKHRKRR
ncbi:ubiquitin carboxyl-terminal hydrolase calypso-like [Nilaparvata lugens]|uniref:ubiquitin carboxyl-terminal hydrolase calypso-like n=1 Tax=Nilaparvata lugens TaxID=108931 RepID=UPI00193DE5D1|nr:ubiquitin carboxyl-terminal hydrolase calypso-like [Nilaparvata lugens]